MINVFIVSIILYTQQQHNNNNNNGDNKRLHNIITHREREREETDVHPPGQHDI